jgi:hypothetical protein
MARTFGADLVQRISEGSLAQIPSEYLARTRDDVSQAIEELIDVGARVRPLYADGKQVGWVRRVHLAERRRQISSPRGCLRYGSMTLLPTLVQCDLSWPRLQRSKLPNCRPRSTPRMGRNAATRISPTWFENLIVTGTHSRQTKLTRA